MLEGTAPALIYEWQAFYELEPFGDLREDLRMANICVAVTGAAGCKKKDGGDFKISNFMFDFDSDKNQSSETSAMNAQAIMRQRYGNDSKSSSKSHG